MPIQHHFDGTCDVLTWDNGHYYLAEKVYNVRGKNTVSACLPKLCLVPGEMTWVKFTEPALAHDYAAHTREPDAKGRILPVGGYGFVSLKLVDRELLVSVGTTLGFSPEELSRLVANQNYRYFLNQRKSALLDFLAENLKVNGRGVGIDACVPELNGLGRQIGSGEYRFVEFEKDRQPLLIKQGMPISEVIDQLR
jgi:hypothetical protein